MTNAKGKKIAITATIILALILALTPRLVGSTVETATVDTLLDMIPTEVGAILEITPTEFQSGWFASNAQIDVRYQPLDGLSGRPVSLSFNMAIKHGPLLFTSSGVRIGLAYADITPALTGLDFNELVPDIDFSETDLDFYIFVGFSNSIEIGFDLAEFVASEPDTSLRLAGITGHLTLASDQSSVMNVNSDEIVLNSANRGFDITISSIAFDSSRANVGQIISPGTAKFSIPQLSSSAPLPIVINDVTVDYALEYNEADQDKINISQLFSVNDFEWDIPLSSLKLSSELNRVDRVVFEQYFSLIEEMQNLGVSNPTVVNAQVAALGEEFALILARESLELNNMLEANAYDGDHSLDLQIAWQGIPGLTAVNAVNFTDIINALTISLSLDADDAALSQSPIGSILEQYKNQGMLIVENGRVFLNGSLENGQLTINDESLPIEQFIEL